jgi:hypothetical protein
MLAHQIHQRQKKWLDSKDAKYKKTEKTTRYLRSLGHTVIEMWEYRYRHLLRHNPALRTFVANKRSTTPQRKMSEKELLREVTTDRLFGMLEGLHRHVTVDQRE